MFKLTVIVKSPDKNQDDLQKEIGWPSVPSIGHKLELGPVTGIMATVTEVRHWFSTKEIEIICELVEGYSSGGIINDFEYLKEGGWMEI